MSTSFCILLVRAILPDCSFAGKTSNFPGVDSGAGNGCFISRKKLDVASMRVCVFTRLVFGLKAVVWVYYIWVYNASYQKEYQEICDLALFQTHSRCLNIPIKYLFQGHLIIIKYFLPILQYSTLVQLP